MQIMHKSCKNYASYVTFTQNLYIHNEYYAQIMHKLCTLCINYALIMHKLCTLCKNYAKITQKLRKNYAKITQKLRKNYAYVCKLHNLHYYAPPTLLIMPAAGRTALAGRGQPVAKLGPIELENVAHRRRAAVRRHGLQSS